MARWVMMVLALMISGVAMAQEAVDQETFALRTKAFEARYVRLAGIMSMADADGGMLEYDAKRLKMQPIAFRVEAKDSETWERARLECNGVEKREVCRVELTGKVVENELFPGMFSIQLGHVFFLK